MSRNVIIGVAVGVAVIVCILFGVVFATCYRLRKMQNRMQESSKADAYRSGVGGFYRRSGQMIQEKDGAASIRELSAQPRMFEVADRESGWRYELGS